MVAKVSTISFLGLEAREIEVEVHLSNGLPSLVIVGLVNKAVIEAKERIRSAINSIGFSLPAKRIVINLSPANFAKEGTCFDLPIAIAILIGMGMISQESIGNYIVIGELSLDGSIRSVNGVLPTYLYASQKNAKLICPRANISECKIEASKVNVIASDSLFELVQILNGEKAKEIFPFEKKESLINYNSSVIDMSLIKGQYVAKRGALIAACGGHNILLTGHPGTGKSMLASAFAGILPPLTDEEISEITSIYSLAGLLKNGNFITERPYRAPHHSASNASVIGGGKVNQFGEITLAHKGVLFLDELPEFERSVLDSLRQPLENGSISIARADYRITYPASFQLFAAMNRCKCGYFGDPMRQCRKVPQCGLDYEGKVSGPIMDRIDIIVEVETESVFDYEECDNLETTDILRKKVIMVRELQYKRYKDIIDNVPLNSKLYGEALQKYCNIDQECKDVLKLYSNKFPLSMRGYSKVLKVARTIADLEESENIQKDHISEALCYRNKTYALKLQGI